MDVLKVELHLQDRLESLNTSCSRIGAFGRFAIVQSLDVLIDVCFPFLSVEEFLHPCRSWKCSILETERAISRAGKGLP